jgi:hypothetical protein
MSPHGSRAASPTLDAAPVPRVPARLAIGVVGLVGLAQAAVLWGLRAGRERGIGLDLDLWSLAAANLRDGFPSPVEPGYPMLLSLPAKILGIWPVTVAAPLSALMMWWVAPLISGLALIWGARPHLALVAGLLCATCPSLQLLGVQIAPDSATTLLIVALSASLAYLGGGKWGSWLLSLGIYGLLCLTRHHALVLLVPLSLFLMSLPASWSIRALRGLLPGLTLLFSPLLVGEAPALPWSTPWGGRIGLAAGDAMAKDPSWMAKTPGSDSGILWIIQHNLEACPEGWLSLGLGLLAALTCRPGLRGPLLVGLSGALPALLIFSQPRHVLVVLPLSLLALSLTGPGLPNRFFGDRFRGVGLRVLPALGFLWAFASQPATAELERLDLHAARAWAYAQHLCPRVSPGDLRSGETIAFVGCPLPAVQASPGPEANAADWRTWHIGPEAPSNARWQRIELVVGTDLTVWRIDPDARIRPCATAQLAEKLPYIAPFPSPVRFDPPCDPTQPNAYTPTGPAGPPPQQEDQHLPAAPASFHGKPPVDAQGRPIRMTPEGWRDADGQPVPLGPDGLPLPPGNPTP